MEVWSGREVTRECRFEFSGHRRGRRRPSRYRVDLGLTYDADRSPRNVKPLSSYVCSRLDGRDLDYIIAADGSVNFQSASLVNLARYIVHLIRQYPDLPPPRVINVELTSDSPGPDGRTPRVRYVIRPQPDSEA